MSKLGDKETDPNERQNKTQEKELNKMYISNPLDAELKTWVIRILKGLREDINSIKISSQKLRIH